MLTTVLFDFDGTLIDTHNLIIEGFNYISMKYRGMPFGANEHLSMLGKPLDAQLRMICPTGANAYITDFQQWYRDHHDHHARPYDDVHDMLHLLKSEGYRLGIVTNNSRQGLQLGLDLLGLESLFDVIVTRDDVSECKPSPEGMYKALHRLNVRSAETMFVGDSAGDIIAARTAGVMPVLVGWTTLSLEQIHLLAPAELIESPYEIPFLLSLINAEIA